MYALLVAGMMSLLYGIESLVLGGLFVPGRGIVSMIVPVWFTILAIFVFFFISITILFILFWRTPDRLMICPKCDAAKNDDGNITCLCGGKFEPIIYYRWVEEKKTS